MSALYPRFAALCALAIGMAGCSGRTISGVWYGPMPGTGYQDCRIELRHGGSLVAVCQSPEKTTLLGDYRFEGEDLSIQLQAAVVGEKQSQWDGARLEFKLEGPGNKVTLSDTAGGTAEWERRPE